MPVVGGWLIGLARCDGVEVGGGGDCEDVADVSAGGCGWTALIGEHVFYEGLVCWVLGGGGVLLWL